MTREMGPSEAECKANGQVVMGSADSHWQRRETGEAGNENSQRRGRAERGGEREVKANKTRGMGWERSGGDSTGRR